MGGKCCKGTMLERVAITFGFFAALAAAQDQPNVTVDQGVLVGTTETFREFEFIRVNKRIDVFKGIPFAEPPVGPLRFQPPVPKGPWGGTYDATYFRDACVQEEVPGITVSEDCLHLNIYAPNPRRPGGVAVMVWIHGGGLNSGSASLPGYNGLPLVAVGDVILVTINYRLSVFGFLTTGDEASPGNVGHLDQVLALKWIKRNIAAFGGDDERITIFGESAGAGSVGLLLVSQKAAGLFNQAILQSGNGLAPWAFYEDRDLLRQQAFQVGERLNCSASDSDALLNCLRDKDAMDLLDASPQALFRAVGVIDGNFLEDTPANLYASGRYNRAKLLHGMNKDEGTFYVYFNRLFREYSTKEEPPSISREIFDQILTEQLVYGYGGSSEQLEDAIKMWYIDWSQTVDDDADYFRTYVDISTDTNFACPTDQVARIHAQGGDDVFVYQMTHAPSVSYWTLAGNGPGWLGAGHAEDVPLVFGFPFITGLSLVRGELQDEEKALSVKFMEFWTNFAKTGNPGLKTPISVPESDQDFWPRFTIPELEYKVLDLNLTTSKALKSNECHFWNTYTVQLNTMLAEMDDAEREWRQAFSTWKYTDMVDWREQFQQYKADSII